MTPPSARRRIVVCDDHASLMEELARQTVEIGNRAIAARGRFSWVLTGGRTPRPLYELLASDHFKRQLDWSKVHFFWGDERCVPPSHHDSNFRMAREALLDAIEPLPDHVHRMRGEDDPRRAADDYAHVIAEFFEVAAGAPPPSFDLVLLGMGDDGHTASLFPGTAALDETDRWVVSNYVPPLSAFRLTMTAPLLSAAHEVALLVSGAGKTRRLADALSPFPEGKPRLPVQMIQPTSGNLTWMVDREAASLLQSTP